MRIIVRTLATAAALTLGTLAVPAAHAGSTWIVRAKASATTLTAGQKITFTGTVRPGGAAAGQKVLLQEQFKPGAAWAAADHGKVDHHGRYTLADKPTSNHLHAYRVVMPADGNHDKGVSKTMKVTVFKWVPLSTLDPVNNVGMEFNTVAINGKSFKESVFGEFTRRTDSVEFNLGHQCAKLRSTFGVSDDSSTGGQAEVGVLSDGTSVYDKSFDLGQSETKTLQLKNQPLKLKLVATDLGTAPGVFGLGAFGTPEAFCTK